MTLPDAALEPQQAPEPTPAPAAAVPEPPKPGKRSLEDSLAALDDATRAFVLSEVTGARQEAKNLRDRVKEAEPIVAKFRELEEANKSELERAQEAAKSAQERAAIKDQRIAAAEIKAALAGIVPDPAAVVEDLNLARFMKDGEVDAEAVAALRTKYTALAPAASRLPAPNPAQGAGGGAPIAGQMTRDEVERLGREGKHAEIDKARKEGRLNSLLGIT